MRRAILIRNLALLLVVAASCAFAQKDDDKGGLPARLPVNEWIAGPEQHLPGWTFRVDPPVVTFPQRFAITVQAEASVAGAKLVGHDLHFFVKVADANGKWFPDRRHTSIEKLPKLSKVVATEHFFAKPGDYQIAFLIYDPVNGTHGVWHHKVHVPIDDRLLSYPSASPIEFIDPDDPFKPADVPVLPPVGNDKALRVDLILNLTERGELELVQTGSAGARGPHHSAPHFITPPWQLGRSRQDFATESLISVAAILDEIKVKGCVTVSVVDAVRSKVMLDRRRSLDPSALLDALKSSRDTEKVDAHVLVARQHAGTFLHNFLQTVTNDNSGCSEGSRQIDRAIVLMSDALVFPESSQLTPIAAPPVATPLTRYYFFRMTVPDFVTQIGFGHVFSATPMSPDDQVGRLLKDVDVHRFDLAEPKDFEKSLPKFLEDLKSFSSGKP